MRVIFARISSNRKTGPMPVSTIEESSCPSACPLKGNGCYGDGGPIRWQWSKVAANPRALSWDGYCEKVAELPAWTLWRHAQVGDLPGADDVLDREKVIQLAEANRGRCGFGYTHYPVVPANVAVLREAADLGFVINLSADTLVEADIKAETGLPVSVILPRDQKANLKTPDGRKVVVCPYPKVRCIDCGLCQKNRPIIGFPAHGAGAAKAESVFNR